MVSRPELTYDLSDVIVMAKVSTQVHRLVRGESVGKFKSRSERDFAVMAEVIRRSGTYDLIKFL
ncbi:MAG: hypothetical protein LN417_01570, partial [Candidatus Thermoplasmatota archaeon]|nr:hypothetical protein [Candidatus Thermoplasmatota archaeon]